jgi:ribokinase
VALITVDESGDNTIVVAPLANAAMDADQVDDAVAVIASSAILLTQLEIPLAVVGRALEVARGAGVTTILNPAPATLGTRLASILPLVDIVIPNRSEAAILSGRDDPVEAARWLVATGPRSAVVTLGEGGAVWFDGATVRRVKPFPAGVVDPTAAGDAFCGALAAALAEGRSLAESLDWASAAGACTVTLAGAIPSLPSRSDVAALLAQRRSAGG